MPEHQKPCVYFEGESSIRGDEKRNNTGAIDEVADVLEIVAHQWLVLVFTITSRIYKFWIAVIRPELDFVCIFFLSPHVNTQLNTRSRGIRNVAVSRLKYLPTPVPCHC